MRDGRRCSPRLAATTLVALRRLLELTLGYMAITPRGGASPAPPGHACLAAETCGPGGRNVAGPRGAPTPSTLNRTHHITHNLTHVELAPDGPRRVEYRRVALSQTLSIPVVAAPDDRGHRNFPGSTFAQHRRIPCQHPGIR